MCAVGCTASGHRWYTNRLSRTRWHRFYGAINGTNSLRIRTRCGGVRSICRKPARSATLSPDCTRFAARGMSAVGTGWPCTCTCATSRWRMPRFITVMGTF
uniref:(northern house mosquito) hypothetical protein n=1 Tax=Culex pipiens TaxID=7175 RepID=A0A8D8GU05_CULPI